MYTVTTAASTSSSVLVSDARKASAAPWKLVSTEGGRSSAACSALIASTAAPSDAPGARLNDTVADGNCPTWLIASAAGCSTTAATDASGTCTVPVAATPGTYSDSSARGPRRSSGAAS